MRPSQGWCYCRREDPNRLPHSLLQPTWRQAPQGILPTAYPIKAGAEIGRFELGSTVVLLFQKDQVELDSLELGQTVRLGETLGRFHSPKSP